jgi:hypothetical protein
MFANGPTIVTNGLVLALDAGDKNSYVSGSTTWFDLTGVNNGTLTNGPTFNSGSGGSIVFDGVDDNAVLGNVLNLGTGNMTINSWINLSAQNSIQTIYSKAYYGVQNYRYSFWVFSNNRIGGFIQGNSGDDVVPYGSTTINTNTWYMATMVINRNANIQLYINGILETLTGLATISQWVGLDFQSNNPARWASYTYSDNSTPNLLFNGKIGLGQIYNRALSTSEIQQNYNATKGRFGLT